MRVKKTFFLINRFEVSNPVEFGGARLLGGVAEINLDKFLMKKEETGEWREQ